MDPVWYYVRGGKQTGPVSFDELKSAAAAGQIAPGDLVWQEGTADWVAARTVAGLFAGPPVPPAVPPDGVAEPLPLDDHGRPAGAKSSAADIMALATEFLRRATAPNPATIAPNPAEEDRLTQAGITEPTARKYAVWRRAMLWVVVVPMAFAALFGFINAIGAETTPLSGFGVLILYLEALVFFAVPASAVMGALAYDRPRDSVWWVRLGALVMVGVPLLFAFIPVGWLLSGSIHSAVRGTMEAGIVGMIYFTLMTMVLSLLPAVSRACIRVKAFLPQSLVPGWGLVASVPLFVLLTISTVVLLYQMSGNILLILGLLLWIGAPLYYLTKFRLLTTPLTQKRDIDSLGRAQTGVLMMITGGIILLIIFLFDAKVIGTDSDNSMLRPWSLQIHEKWIEFVGRSLFMTVVFADLLVRMSLSVWREEKAFAASENAAAFDGTMTALAETVEGKRAG
jgi:hypothetical protein